LAFWILTCVWLSWWRAEALAATAAPPDFGGAPVHPLDLSRDGTTLCAVHLADARLAIFDVAGEGPPIRRALIPVGLEPVTVRLRNNHEAWVVNHLSDTVNRVDLANGRVTATLRVGDEPTDLIFAGNPERLFVCVRGGPSRQGALQVFDPDTPLEMIAEIPLRISRPRALACSADLQKIYVCALDGGNQTTIVPYDAVLQGGGAPPPVPPMDPSLPFPPATGLIVQWNAGHWMDEIGRWWDAWLPYRVLDHDIAIVDASALVLTGHVGGAGTNLFNLAVHPRTGEIHATNQEAFNQVRFEPNLRGHFAQNRISVVHPSAGTVTTRHLNPHIDYEIPEGSEAERALSLGLPLDVVIARDGTTYVAAFGSRMVGVLGPRAGVVARLPVGRGPCGLALDEDRGLLYVLNRFDASISVVDLARGNSVTEPLGFDPTPASIAEGADLFFHTNISSAHGDLSCASCHLFGDVDGLAWDLGNPQGEFVDPPFYGLHGFHPMKGPMITQSLKGLPGTGPLHWRGDRPAFADFNPAFVSLLGLHQPFDPLQMELIQEYIFTLRHSPNPYRRLDDGLPPGVPEAGDPANGEIVFHRPGTDEFAACVDCHALPTGTSGMLFDSEFIHNQQDFKAPHLRGLYNKTSFELNGRETLRGFGYTHDGSFHDLRSFLENPRFTFQSESELEDVLAFLLCFDSGASAAVGEQVTILLEETSGEVDTEGRARLDTLMARADFGAAGLVAHGPSANGESRGWCYIGGGRWISDREHEGEITIDQLFAEVAPGANVTFLGVQAEERMRIGVDRDRDGIRDGDERDAGTDPEHPGSAPSHAPPVRLAEAGSPDRLSLGSNPAGPGGTRLLYNLGASGPIALVIYDAGGRAVRRLRQDAVHDAGENSAWWDLKDERGRAVAAGMYFARLETGRGSQGARIVVR